MTRIRTPEVQAYRFRIELLESALKVIHTWATFQGGGALVPRDTAKLCARVLRLNKARRSA